YGALSHGTVRIAARRPLHHRGDCGGTRDPRQRPTDGLLGFPDFGLPRRRCPVPWGSYVDFPEISLIVPGGVGRRAVCDVVDNDQVHAELYRGVEQPVA